ncbi:UNVERIFIED_CONTAM: hypothetical protein GTU68_031039 [Idotea baltica]|nr:hypothetical protein [Idotea baltica]
MGRLDNGYHLLETLFYPVPDLFDWVVVDRTDSDACTVDMPGFPESVPLEKNLAWKAWQVMHSAFPDRVKGIAVEIRKSIPAGAGLGGGSSNAAAVMEAINQLYALDLGADALAALAEPLGADVPFFVYGKPLYATGIGNRFETLELDLQGFHLEVLPQPFHSSTPAAYRGLDLAGLDHPTSLKALLQLPPAEWRGKVLNDLEGPVFAQFPELKEEVERMYTNGAIYAAMTGSGSAVFALFEKPFKPGK